MGTAAEAEAILAEPQLPPAVPGIVIDDLRKAIAYVGNFSRFLYGSDWPLAPMASYPKLIEAVIPKEHRTKVLQENAAKLFSLCS